jgi:uncharacterized membrane protein (DUF441 family)
VAQVITGGRRRYDWKACAIAIAIGLAVATAAGLAVTLFARSTLLLTAVVTVVGTSVSQWVYARVAARGSRPIDCDENCPL